MSIPDDTDGVGAPGGVEDIDDALTSDEGYRDDDITVREESMETVTNDAVAGDTVMPGAGEGNWGPTGGSPGEQQPEYAENDLAGEEIDLDDGT